MKIKFVCRVLIIPHANFCNNRKLLIKFRWWEGGGEEKELVFFLLPPTSLKHEIYGLTSGFTRLIMKTKYFCHGLISLHVNFRLPPHLSNSILKSLFSVVIMQ